MNLHCCRDKKSKFRNSLRSRRLEVVGERENGRARGRLARGEGAPARKAPENRFPPPSPITWQPPFFHYYFQATQASFATFAISIVDNLCLLQWYN